MKNILFTILVVFLLCACYDDESTLPQVEYPTIVASRQGEDQYLTVSLGEEFIYEPRLGRMQGRDTIPLTESEFENYSYEWSLSLLSTGIDTTKEVISDERILKTFIGAAPTNDGYSYYTLTLQVTHKASHTKKNLFWELKVLSTYGAGLLVAETPDENNSDISLIMSPTFNTNLADYKEDTVWHNVFSKHNNTWIKGKVSSLAYISKNGHDAITALAPEETLVRMDPITMELMDQDLACFFYTPPVFNPQLVITCWSKSILINNGQIQYYDPVSGTKYSFYPEVKYDLATMYAAELNWADVILWDKNAGKFVYKPTASGEVLDLANTVTEKFNPNDMRGCECIYGETTTRYERTKWLMKKEGRYYVYVLDCVKDKGEINFVGVNVYDLENCPDIEKSPCYGFSNNDEFFYSVDNILYAVPLVKEKPERQVSYDRLASTEKITHILIHRGSGKTTWSENMDPETGKETPVWRNSKNNVLCIATWDGHEGRVYTLPVQYSGTGGIAADKYVKCYDKFSRITGIAPRK